MPDPFTFEKWYLDAVSPTRRAAIGYWASLAWRGLRVSWQGVTEYPPGEPPLRRWSARPGEPPAPDGARIRWDSEALDSGFAGHAGLAPIAEHLFGGVDRVLEPVPGVDWRCDLPAGEMRVRLPQGRVLEGVGYAERIAMRVAPWRLPIRELAWGRWCDLTGSRSVVWIEWRGDTTTRWVYLDGRRVDAELGVERLHGPQFDLRLSDRTTLEQRSFAEVARGIPRLLRALPRTMREMQEEKWLSSGVLQLPGSGPTPGLAIHERVVMG